MKLSIHNTGLIFDLFFSFIYMPLIILVGPAHFWLRSTPLFFCLTCAYLYACYFVTRRMPLPRMILSRRYPAVLAIALSLVTLTWLLTLYPLPKIEFVTPSMSEYQTRVRNYSVSISIWFMFFAVICYSITVSFVRELYERRLRQNQLESQNAKAQLAVFKAQISPHFLFNTLNSLYSLVIGTSEKAENAFIKFSDLLKYSYTTIENDYVTIDREIEYIKDYIELQQLRLDRHTRVEWTADIDDPKALIPPMIFLTFVENAFKYGSSTSRDCRIELSLALRRGQLTFNTRNRVLRHADEFRTAVPVGLDNTRKRLDVLYPGRFTLLTEETDGLYIVNLTIDLNDNATDSQMHRH